MLDETSLPKEGKYSFRIGDEATITCSAHGDPPLTITWYYKGQRVQPISNHNQRHATKNLAQGSEDFFEFQDR